jgi:SMC interacting uncharacterized protein involved in chromosome segregation
LNEIWHLNIYLFPDENKVLSDKVKQTEMKIQQLEKEDKCKSHAVEELQKIIADMKIEGKAQFERNGKGNADNQVTEKIDLTTNLTKMNSEIDIVPPEISRNEQGYDVAITLLFLSEAHHCSGKVTDHT